MIQRSNSMVLDNTSVGACGASPGSAQTPYYAGKTITIIAGTKAGDVYDTVCAHVRAAHAQVHSRKSQYHCPKHARRRIDDRRQFRLQSCRDSRRA